MKFVERIRMKVSGKSRDLGGPISGFATGSEAAKREAWLLENKAALESLQRGIEQAEKGEVCDLGSFAEFADDEID
jgi:hypothetical protein